MPRLRTQLLAGMLLAAACSDSTAEQLLQGNPNYRACTGEIGNLNDFPAGCRKGNVKAHYFKCYTPMSVFKSQAAREVCAYTDATGKHHTAFRINHSYGSFSGGKCGFDFYDTVCLIGPPAARNVTVCEGCDDSDQISDTYFAVPCYKGPSKAENRQAYADSVCAWYDADGNIHQPKSRIKVTSTRGGGQCGITHYQVHCEAGAGSP